eukprot:CAMPEP_0116119746 /NCGR_PEP_ID=MMETSP0329-20121206/2809_1 /TAXON_ID=697910 /ORGANISM="Pseudo-nitzschia arenysensis, Strain B593" /LENGTH=290 /DNA_ID=CAMNT_0003613475 /DNA_START=213 /DNA_END=1082 /DNA_ORIENTATION=-
MAICLFEDHVTVVALVDGLRNDSHESNHRQSSVVDFLVLVVNPSFIGVVNPVGSSQKIARLVSRAVLDLLGEPFDGTASQDELEPSDSRELLGGLKRVVRKRRVEGGVDSGGIEVPSEAGSHGNTSVLELGLTVHVHGGIVLALGKAHGVEESHRGGDTNDILVLPGGKRSLCCLRLLGRSKGGAVLRYKKQKRKLVRKQHPKTTIPPIEKFIATYRFLSIQLYVWHHSFHFVSDAIAVGSFNYIFPPNILLLFCFEILEHVISAFHFKREFHSIVNNLPNMSTNFHTVW